MGEKPKKTYIDYRLGHIRLSEKEEAEIRANGGVSEEEYMAVNDYLGEELEAGAIGTDDGVMNGVEKGEAIIVEPEPPIIDNPIHDPIPGPIGAVKNPEPTKSEEKEEGEDKEDKDKKPKVIGIIGIAIVGGILGLALKSCDGPHRPITIPDNPFEYTRAIESDEEHPFEIAYVEAEPPQERTLGTTGESGQEGLTNNVIDREKETLRGQDYNADVHAKEEKASVEGFDEYIQRIRHVREDLAKLEDQSLTQDEKKSKLESIEQETQAMGEQYEAKEGVIDRETDTFKKRTLKHKDSISEDEINVLGKSREDFYEEENDISNSLEGIQELKGRMEDGERVDIEDVEMDKYTKGLHIIRGKSVETVVEEQHYKGIQAIWERFRDWVRGEPTREETKQEITQDQGEVQKQDTDTNER